MQRCDACGHESDAVGRGSDLPPGWETVMVPVGRDNSGGVHLCPDCCRDKVNAAEKAKANKWKELS